MLQSTGVQIIEHDLMTEKKQIIIHLYKFPSEGTLCMLWSHLFKLLPPHRSTEPDPVHGSELDTKFICIRVT